MKLNIKKILPLAISILLLYIFFKLTKFKDVVDVISYLSKWEFLLLTSLSLLSFILWSLTFYNNIKRNGYMLSYSKFLITHAIGNFLKRTNPLGEFGGEFLMAYAYSKELKIPYSNSLGIIFSSGTINSLPSYAMAILGFIYFIDKSTLKLTKYFLSPFIIILIFLIVLYFVYFERNFLERITLKIINLLNLKSKFQKRLRVSINNFYSGIDNSLKFDRTLAKILILSILASLGEILILYFIFQIFNMSLNFIILLLVVPLSFLVIHLPLPGGLGGVELTMSFLLNLLGGIPLKEAASIVLLFRLISFWIPVFLGAILFVIKIHDFRMIKGKDI